MKPLQWKTYRTRFLVKARKLTSSLSFIDPLGRQHCGRKGDYLVESFDGVISIASRHIFEDIYVAMCAEELAAAKAPSTQPGSSRRKSPLTRVPLDRIPKETLNIEALNIEALNVETIKSPRPPLYFQDARQADAVESPRARRKSPQPVRSASSRMSLM